MPGRLPTLGLDCGSAAKASSPKSLWEMQTLRPHPGPNEWESPIPTYFYTYETLRVASGK